MNIDDEEVFSAGDCPVCADSGALIGLVSTATGAVVLFCPLCETSWDQRPNDGRVDTVLSLGDVAPTGTVLAKRSQIMGSKLGPFERVDSGEWLELLAPHLIAPPLK
jgi:hypothetical protein